MDILCTDKVHVAAPYKKLKYYDEKPIYFRNWYPNVKAAQKVEFPHHFLIGCYLYLDSPLKICWLATGIMVIDPYKCHGQVFEHWSNYNWVNSLFTRALMLIPYSCTPVRTWRKLWTSSTNWCRTSTSSSPWWGPWRSRGRSPWVTSKWPWPLFCLNEGFFGGGGLWFFLLFAILIIIDE